MHLFDKPGEQNTDKTLEIAFERATKDGLKHVIVASTRGVVAEKALRAVPDGITLVVVTHSVGFREPGADEFSSEIRKAYDGTRHHVCTATHLFRGLEGYLAKQFNGAYPPQIFATALRMFGEGTKVAFEIAIMAADAGLVPIDRWVVSCGGTGRGLDTAYVLKPCNTTDLRRFRFGELLAIPSEYQP